jgi:excisionase family DNA binding protein
MEITFENLPKAVTNLAFEISEIKRLLLSTGNNTQSTQNDILTIEQAAKLLSLSVPTIYGYVHRKAIPYSKPGKRLYFKRTELLSWINDGRKKTLEEIESEAHTLLIKPKK